MKPDISYYRWFASALLPQDANDGGCLNPDVYLQKGNRRIEVGVESKNEMILTQWHGDD